MSKSKKNAKQESYILTAREEFYQKLTEIEELDAEYCHEVLNLLAILNKQLDNLVNNCFDARDLIKLRIMVQENCFQCLTLLKLISGKINVDLFETIGRFAYRANELVNRHQNRDIILSKKLTKRNRLQQYR